MRQVSRGEQRLAVRRIAGAALRIAEASEHGSAPFVAALEQVEGRCVEGHCLVVGELGTRPIAGGQRVPHCLLARAGDRSLAEVAGECGQVLGTPLLEDLRDRAVESHTTARAELVVQSRAHQRMGEAPPVDRHLVHEATLHRTGQGEQHVLLGEPRRRRQHFEVELATDHRRDAKQLVGLRAEPTQASSDDLADALRQPDHVRGHRRRPPTVLLVQDAGLGEVAEHLADEERVALGLLSNDACEVTAAAPCLLPRGPLEEVDDVFGGEAVERDALDALDPAEVGEHLSQRITALQVGVAIGADDQHAHRGLGRHDVAQEQQRRSSRPVQVIDDQQDGTVGAHRHEPLDHRVEEPIPLGLGIGAGGRGQVEHARRDLGQQADELAAVATERARERVVFDVIDREAQCFDERLVRHAELFLAATEQHRCAVVVHLASELRCKPRLADPGLTRDEHDVARARRSTPCATAR